jgi:hypothetical protein
MMNEPNGWVVRYEHKTGYARDWGIVEVVISSLLQLSFYDNIESVTPQYLETGEPLSAEELAEAILVAKQRAARYKRIFQLYPFCRDVSIDDTDINIKIDSDGCIDATYGDGTEVSPHHFDCVTEYLDDNDIPYVTEHLSKIDPKPDKEYTPSEIAEMRDGTTYYGHVPGMKEAYCACKGWGCVFCCENHDQQIGKNGGGG